MVFSAHGRAIPKACGFEAATRKKADHTVNT
jgi:hypothetical protein